MVHENKWGIGLLNIYKNSCWCNKQGFAKTIWRVEQKKAGETNEKFETPHDAAPVAGRGLREMTTSKKGDGKA